MSRHEIIILSVIVLLLDTSKREPCIVYQDEDIIILNLGDKYYRMSITTSSDTLIDIPDTSMLDSISAEGK